MTMEKGYYKPEIEEFCIGLQIEVFQPALNKYHLCPFTEKCNFYEYNIDLCRVKLLDREDIESCGFKEVGGVDADSALYFMNDKFAIIFEPENSDDNIPALVIYSDIDTNEQTSIFSGTIRNKTEFKKLLKQLGI